MVFIDTRGLGISSIRYKSRREGRARKIRIRAGRMVQIVSRVLASRSWREVRRDTINLISMYLTKVTVIVTTSMA